MEIMIVRHARAEDRDAQRWADDARRPLTAAGARRFRAVARALRGFAPTPGVVLSSRWDRAWATAELLAENADWPAPTACEALELGSVEDTLAAIAQHRMQRAVAVVGHEPQLGEFVSYLLTGQEDAMQVNLKKGGGALIEMPAALAPGAGVLRWLITPKMLRANDGGEE